MSKAEIVLVQIHYHDREGGVVSVMHYYAEAFKVFNGARKSVSVALCASQSPTTSKLAKSSFVLATQAFDYTSFRTKKEYTASVASCKNTIKATLSKFTGAKIYVVAHNMTLGKNCAVSAAFAQCARELASSSICFFSVIHDFAEEGRLEMLRNIRCAKRFDFSIEEDLYAANSGVTTIAISKRSYEILRKNGLNPVLLPNPVEIPNHTPTPIASRRKKFEQEVAKLAHVDTIKFDKSRPIVLYPVRIIRRKNIAEAFLLTCVFCNATLITGPVGASLLEADLVHELQKRARTHNLTFIPNINRIGEGSPLFGKSKRLYAYLYACADVCISTSIAEGFGYAFYEPWGYGKMIAGRKTPLAGAEGGLDLSYLYTTLPVQVSRATKTGILKDYIRYRALCNLPTDDSTKPAKFAKSNSMVDFGMLNNSEKLAVIDGFLDSKVKPTKKLSPIVQKQRAILAREWPIAASLIEKNCAALEAHCSLSTFGSRLVDILTKKNTPRSKVPPNHGGILEYFASFEQFNRNMTSE